MTPIKEKRKAKTWGLGVIGLLFGLGFGAGALLAGWIPVFKTASTWYEAREWTPVQATVLQAKLERYHGEATTYQVTARYAYEFRGREYQSERIGLLDFGSDNFGDWHHRWYGTLKTAQDQGYRVKAWMDPQHPERAVLDREVRWGAMAFHLAFAIGFLLASAVGWALLWTTIRGGGAQEAVAENKSTTESRNASGGKASIVVGLAILSLGLFFSRIIYSNHPTPDWPWLFVLVPLTGFLMIRSGMKARKRERTSGRIALRLDEQRPQLGERMHGAIEFERSAGAGPYTIRLCCERVDNSGDSTSYTGVWVKELQVRPVGKRLPFLFELPADVPASEPYERIHHRWSLQLDAEEDGYPLDFEVTVFAPEGQASIASVPLEASQAEVRFDSFPGVGDFGHDDKESIPLEIATVVTGLDRLRIDYNSGLHRSVATGMAIMALIFGGATVFTWSKSMPLFPLVLGGIGAIVLYFALKCMWLRLSVVIESGALQVEEATVFGKKQYSVPVGDIVELVPTSSYTSGRTTYLKLYAVTKGGEAIVVGGGLTSQLVAKNLLRLLHRHLREEVSIAQVEYATRNRVPQKRPPAEYQARTFRTAVNVIVLFVFAGVAWTFYPEFRGASNSDASSTSGKWNAATSSVSTTSDAWFAAVNANRLDELKAMAAKGFDIDTQASNGSSALAQAATNGYLETARWLVESGADIHQRNSDKSGNNYQTTPLMRAGYGGNPEIIALLLSKGADIHAQDRFNRTPLHFSGWNGCDRCIRLLVKQGADLEAKATGNHGETPLMIAAGMGRIDGVRTLLDLGADARAKDKFGKTALGWAQDYNRPAVIELLERLP